MSEGRKGVIGYVLDAAAALVLFCATAGIVWWQNTHLTVLYDLSGVLEPAMRIAQGDMPYRDFPFPYAPLTFLTQAALIKLTGAIYWHHIVYCCIIAGLATLLAWRILVNVLGGIPRTRLVAFLLTLPAAILGVYCVFPHPFYDPDACFVTLLCVWLLLIVERRAFPPIASVLVGALFVVPLFIKQNIGLAFLGGIGLWLIAAIVVALKKKETVRPYLYLVGGIAVGLAAAAVIVHLTCGIETYKYWTWDFATSRRAPSMLDMLSVYADWTVPVWAAVFLAGAWLVLRAKEDDRWRAITGTLLMCVPFAWPVVYLLVDADASERAERLIGVWPLTFIVLLILAYGFVRRLSGVAAGLPLILIATAHGVFLSQQLWGSTYGIWPLLAILLGLLLRQFYDPENGNSSLPAIALALWIAVCLSVAGGFYIYSNERLDYVSFDDGEMAHSALPQLGGMSMRGDYLPDFDELVTYTNANIPPEDGVLCLPGEDLFNYATGRHPHFPVLLFDVTNNPYNADEIRSRVIAGDIEWLVVKNDLEIEADDMIDSKDHIFELLKPDFRHVETLNNYEIYKRLHAGDPPDEDDDSDDPGDGDDDSGD